MKTFIATIEITGLAGVQTHEIKVEAKTASSAEKKAWQVIGNRTGRVISIDVGEWFNGSERVFLRKERVFNNET